MLVSSAYPWKLSSHSFTNFINTTTNRNHAKTCRLSGTPTIMDPFDSYFRVRLVCILLDACGQYFDRGSTKRRLDNYFVYLQCYLFSKKQPQPLEVENLVRDTLETLRPHLVMYITPQEACEAALDLERKYKDKIGERV